MNTELPKSTKLHLVQDLAAGNKDCLSQLDDEAIQGTLEHHGLLPWARWRIQRMDALPELPESTAARLNQAARNLAVQEMAWEQELTELAPHFGQIQVLLFKGADLAQRVYPSAALRPRCDVDLLLRKEVYPDFQDLLFSRGYERLTAIDAPMVSRQACFLRRTASGMNIALDVHWELSNRPALVNALETVSVIESAVSASSPMDGFLVPSLVDALLLACCHRIAHHRRDRRLIWVLDIDLIWQKLSITDRRRFSDKAVRLGVGAICADGLAAAKAVFSTAIADAELELMASHQSTEPSAFLLNAPPGRWSDIRFDYQNLPNWHAKMAFVRQHLFPDRRYMRAKFGTKGNLALPYLYLKRAAGGVQKLFGRKA